MAGEVALVSAFGLNQVAFTTARYRANPLVVQGPGAGLAVTAGGIFNDIAELASGPPSEEAAFSGTSA